MRIGVLREIRREEFRVALTPAGVHELSTSGHEVSVETTAGEGSGFADDDYRAAGARIASTASEVWGGAELLLNVNEPIPEEYPLLREGLVLFAYLHLAANQPLTRALVESDTTAIAYETVQLPDGRLPLLAARRRRVRACSRTRGQHQACLGRS